MIYRLFVDVLFVVYPYHIKMKHIKQIFSASTDRALVAALSRLWGRAGCVGAAPVQEMKTWNLYPLVN